MMRIILKTPWRRLPSRVSITLIAGLMALAVLTMATSACGDGAGDEGAVRIVATSSIVGDIATNVIGSHGSVDVLIPNGADPHEYSPSAQDIAAMRQADLVIAIGLGLEEGLAGSLEAAVDDGIAVLELAPQLDPLPFADGSGSDPHFWLDPMRVATAAELIATALAAADDTVDWMEAARDYRNSLERVDETIRTALGVVPLDRRYLVVNHDSLGYLADRYGLSVIGTIFPAGTTTSQPSSIQLAELATLIDEKRIPAIFSDPVEPADLAAAIAAEAGHSVQVVELYVGALGPEASGADTLAGLLVTNAQLIADALRSE